MIIFNNCIVAKVHDHLTCNSKEEFNYSIIYVIESLKSDVFLFQLQNFSMRLHHKIFFLFLNLRLIVCFNVVGYMPEWRHEGADFDRLCQHLTHLIFFSLEITPKGKLMFIVIKTMRYFH